MTAEATAVVEMPAEAASKSRRGKRAAEGRETSSAQVFFYLAERGQDSPDLVLGERFESEGHAMIEALKRDVPFYKVEMWKSRAVVKVCYAESWNDVAQFPGLTDKNNGSPSGSHNTSCKNMLHMVKSEHFSAVLRNICFTSFLCRGFS